MNRKEKRKLERYLGKDFPIDMLLSVYQKYYSIRGLSITEAILDMLKASVHILDTSIYDWWTYDNVTDQFEVLCSTDDYICKHDILWFREFSPIDIEEVNNSGLPF